jgi:CspA family cold shock protein
VIDCPDTPGRCFAYFSHLCAAAGEARGAGEVTESAGGFCERFEGETVDFEWEPASAPESQDGYSFRAITVHPHGREAPQRSIGYYKPNHAG